MRGPLFGGPLGFYMGSGGTLRAPCPIAVLAAEDLQPRVAIAFFGDPEFRSRDRFGQVGSSVQPPKSSRGGTGNEGLVRDQDGSHDIGHLRCIPGRCRARRPPGREGSGCIDDARVRAFSRATSDRKDRCDRSQAAMNRHERAFHCRRWKGAMAFLHLSTRQTFDKLGIPRQTFDRWHAGC